MVTKKSFKLSLAKALGVGRTALYAYFKQNNIPLDHRKDEKFLNSGSGKL